MEQRKDKQPLEATTIRLGGSIGFAIPTPIKHHSNIQNGTVLHFQREISDTHGPYSSFWNPEQQQTENEDVFEARVFQSGGSLVVAIPQQIREHLQIKEGSLIKLQTEYNDTHGPYSSCWNPGQQAGDQQ